MAKLVRVGFSDNQLEDISKYGDKWFLHLIKQSDSEIELKTRQHFYDVSPYLLKNGDLYESLDNRFSFHGDLLFTSLVQTPYSQSFSQQLRLLDQNLFPMISNHTAQMYNIGFALFEQPLADTEDYNNTIYTVIMLLQDADHPEYQELFAYSQAEGKLPEFMQTLNSEFVDMSNLFTWMGEQIRATTPYKKFMPKSSSGSLSALYTAYTAFLINSTLGLESQTDAQTRYKTEYKGGHLVAIGAEMFAFGVKINIDYNLKPFMSGNKPAYSSYKLKLTPWHHHQSESLQNIIKNDLNKLVEFDKLFNFLIKKIALKV